MTDDEDLRQTIYDYFNIEAQRHRDIMAQASEILAKIAELSTTIDTMKTNLEKALAGASETIPAGHAQVLDTFVAPLDDVEKKLVALEGEMASRIGVIPVPGADPSPGVVPPPSA